MTAEARAHVRETKSEALKILLDYDFEPEDVWVYVYGTPPPRAEQAPKPNLSSWTSSPSRVATRRRSTDEAPRRIGGTQRCNVGQIIEVVADMMVDPEV